MTEQYSFVDRHLVPNIAMDGSVIWQEQLDSVNSTLSDTINDGYVTAEDDTTQYLSVLDASNEMSLENLNITLTNSKLHEEDVSETFISPDSILEQTRDEENEGQVVVYAVEGSDELYGIQLVQDEAGNMQKYQFQFRKNSSGQLEAIPETIQALPMDDEVQEPTEEHILPDNLLQDQGDEEEHESILYQNDAEEETIDVKPGLLSLPNVKQEFDIEEQDVEYAEAEPLSEEHNEEYIEQFETDGSAQFDILSEVTRNANIEEEASIEEPEHLDCPAGVSANGESHMDIEYQEVETLNEEPSEEYLEEPSEEYLEENIDGMVANPEIALALTETPQEQHELAEEDNVDSDIEDYEIVDGVHITGDAESDNIFEKANSISNANILRHTLKKDTSFKTNKEKMYLYVVEHHEKENVGALPPDSDSNNKVIKTNPRSILKSSHMMLQTKNETLTMNQINQKRFSRGKEAIQALNFHNFINKTTIPQAPIRKIRLPRKQEIKPVERMDEEIIVKEVMVSSNAFIENTDAISNNKKLSVTDYVVIDSDDDYDPKRTNVNRKKRRRRRKRIEVSDSEESEESVIDLAQSDDEIISPNEQEVPRTSDDSASSTSPPKRRRGRPPKSKPETETKTDALESPLKKLRIDYEVSEKPEIPCPKCDKSFPSQNSLKTHLQHHNLQTSLKQTLPPESKYKCEECESSFKNGILLKRHVCTKKHICNVCKKTFTDIPQLSAHKRLHNKERLAKSTALAISPKKMLPKSSSNLQAPKNSEVVKCKVCGRVCSSAKLLIIHMKNHKEFKCTRCSATFMSRIILDQHVREKCVKSPAVAKTRLTRRPSNIDIASTSSFRKQKGITVKCDECEVIFQTHRAMFLHKVEEHGLDTPNKNLLKSPKKLLFKPKAAHSGIRPSAKLAKAYAEFQVKLMD